MITLENISKTYPARGGGEAVHALDDVSLQIDRGQVHGVVGPSGSGKSTLVRCINLLERPTSGRVTVDGRELTALSAAACGSDDSGGTTTGGTTAVTSGSCRGCAP